MIRLLSFVFLIANLGISKDASGLELVSFSDSHSLAVLSSEVTQANGSDTVWFAFSVTPREGWHTYWKNPGDSGAPIILDWRFDQGELAGDVLYAAPHRIPYGPLMNYGFEGVQALLIPVKAGPQGIAAVLEAEWLVCEVECVPQIGQLTISIPGGETVSDPSSAARFADARAALPEPSFWSSRLVVGAQEAVLTLYMDQTELAGFQTAYFYPEAEGVLDYAGAQTMALSEEGLTLTFNRPSGAPDVTNAQGVLEFTLNDGSSEFYALEPVLTTAAPMSSVPTDEPGTPVVEPSLPIWQALIFALLGGLILNLMPCVFPVLSLKAFAFVSANYKTDAHRRREGWAYTLGIWASFMVIVVALLAIRAGGTAIGWGFQLQEPLFVAGLAVLMVLVALSLSGMFNIQFGIEGAGQSFASREGATGAFFKGVLAALVATPCTAPFMAPAIGFALTQPILIVLLIFTSLAVGLALPFLLLSYSPALARLMPKPGAWMEKVKQGLAFPMYLTAVWLVYVFDRGVGPIGTFVLLAGIVGIVFAIWLWMQSSGIVARAVATLFVALSLYGVGSEPWVMPAQNAGDGVAEVAYSDAVLTEAAGGPAPVLAYFTADWCITCKVNERVALFTDTTQAALKENNVLIVKGDWTNRNEEIASLLARYGRAGVPLYLYFPASELDPIILPEILAPNSIVDVVQKGV